MNSSATAKADVVPALHPEAASVLEKYLTAGEVLRWADKPQTRWKQELWRFRSGALLVLAFFVLFLFSALFDHSSKVVPSAPGAESSVPQATPPQMPNHRSLEDTLFAGVFFAVFFGIWCFFTFRLMGGQRIVYLLSLSKTYYGLTDQRLIVVVGKKEFRVLSCHLRTIQDLRLQEDSDGIGTIHLGPRERPANPFQGEDVPLLVLKSIPQATQVFGLIFKIQDKLLNH